MHRDCRSNHSRAHQTEEMRKDCWNNPRHGMALRVDIALPAKVNSCSIKYDQLPHGFTGGQLVETLINLIERDLFAHEFIYR